MRDDQIEAPYIVVSALESAWSDWRDGAVTGVTDDMLRAVIELNRLKQRLWSAVA